MKKEKKEKRRGKRTKKNKVHVNLEVVATPRIIFLLYLEIGS